MFLVEALALSKCLLGEMKYTDKMKSLKDQIIIESLDEKQN